MSDNEELLFELKISKGASQADLDAYTKSIEILTAETKDLIDIQNSLKKSGDVLSTQYLENAKTIETNKQKIAEDTTARKTLITVINTEEGATKNLTASNKLLIIERNKLSDSTEDGRKAINKINEQLDLNTAKIKENASGTEKQRMNIGNYKSALDGVVPGLGGFISGLEGMTKASLTFIATPIGLIIGALALAVASLTAYFKGSEEGQNNWNKIAAVGTVIFERFQDVLEYIGEALFSSGKNMDKFGTALKVAFLPLTIIIEQVKFLASTFAQFFPETAANINKFFNDVSADANKLAALQEDITKRERDLEVQRAQTRLQVAQIRKAADESEGKSRLDLVTQAIALDEKLMKSELQLSLVRQQQAKENLRIKGDDIAAKAAVAKADAEVFNQQAAFLEGTRKNNKERVSLTTELNKADKDRADLLKRLAKQNVIDYKEQLDEEEQLRDTARAQEDGESQEDYDKRMKQSSDLLFQETADIEAFTVVNEREAKKQLAIDKAKTDALMNSVQNYLGQIAGQFKKSTLAYKVFATAEVVMSTARAAIAAFGSAAEMGPLGWLLAPIAGGLAIAFGALQVARINGVQFARGGNAWGTTLGGKPHAQGGTKFFGSDGTRFEAEEGEGLYVLKRDAHQDLIQNLSKRNRAYGGVSWLDSSRTQYAALGGSINFGPSIGSENNGVVRAMDRIGDKISSMPIFVSVEDINRAQVDKSNLIRRANVL